MEKTITLNQIGLYNPQRVTDEVIKAIFVVRRKEFDSIIDALTREDDKSIPQHHLIVAQRGMGKTTLLKRIEVELRQSALKERFVPLLFPEEQYNVKDIAEFWLNSLDALADTLELEKSNCWPEVIDDKVKKIMALKNTNAIAEGAYRLLQNIGNEIGRRPILLIDNINTIFSRLSDAEQHTLRAWLTKNGVPIIIGASATTFEQTVNYDAPFYDAFQMHYLRRLTFEEVFQMLINLAEITNNKDVIPSIFEEKGRLKTLHQLTGGNPRTTVMLFKLIARGFSKCINDDLEALLDEVTPIYKARFEELPEQPQVIIDAIALNWDPVTLKQLREITRYENNVLSAQLKRLSDAGWIDRIESSGTKGGAYQISERFFNIWFLMRRSSRRRKKEIYCLARFLECFYGDELTAIAQNHLCSLYTNDDHIAYGLALAEAIKDEELQKRLKAKTYQEIYSLSQKNPEILDKFNVPERYLEMERFKELLEKYRHYSARRSHPKERVGLLNEMLKININDKIVESDLYSFLGVEYAAQENYIDAEQAFKKSIELNGNAPGHWFNLARLYHFNLHKENESEMLYKRAISLDSRNPEYWDHLGGLYGFELDRFDDAVIAFKKAIRLDKNNATHWIGLAELYGNNDKGHEAADAYKKALKIDESNPQAWFELGVTYWGLLNDIKKAEKAFERAISMNDDNAEFLEVQGNIKRLLKKFPEAIELLNKALSIDKFSTSTTASLANTYAYGLNDKNKAISVIKSTLRHTKDKSALTKQLIKMYIFNKDYTSAKKAINKILKSDPADHNAWGLLGVIHHEGYQDTIKAEEAYKKAIEFDIEKEDITAYYMLANLYKDYTKKYDESERLLTFVISKDNDNWLAYNSLGELYTKTGDFKKAEQAYLTSTQLDPSNFETWFCLAELYQDNLRDYPKAVGAYEKASEINKKEICTRVNLTFLYRDKLNQIEKAHSVFNSIKDWGDYMDSYWLNKALFELYEQNEGHAKDSVKNALKSIEYAFPKETQDDWWRFTTIVLKLGKGEWLCAILEETGKNIELGPYYNAIKSLISPDPKAYLNSKAVEIQNATNEVINRLKSFN